MTITRDDLKAVLGQIDEDKVIAILELEPTLSELEEAAALLTGDSDILAKSGHHPSERVAEIVDILTADEDEADYRG